MNHTIKGILIVAAITSMLVLGATTIPITQSSFASKSEVKKTHEVKKSHESKKAHDFKKSASNTDKNININTNRADSSSSSDATAENTNNINNTATSAQSQEQSACAVAVTCPGGTTTVTPTPPSPPPVDECPHSPYTTLVGGLCQNGAPTFTCTSLAGASGDPSGPDANNNCTQEGNNAAFTAACTAAGGTFDRTAHTCTYPATPNCPQPEGSTQTPTVVNGRCTIEPGPA